MRVAAVQLCSTPDKERNRATVAKLAGEAVDAGATFVALPELWNRWGSAAELREGAEPLDGPSLAWAREFARSRRVHLLAGSIVERSGDALHNTSCLVDPAGEIVARYRKLHLFDVDVPGAVHRESATVTAGTDVVVADAGPLRLGLATCYDLRFPELFRAQLDRGATAVTLPSAFTAATGKDHWEPLLRARAIENQVFVIAPNRARQQQREAALARPVDDRRPVGHRARAGAGPRRVDRCGPGPRCADADPDHPPER